MRLRLRSWSWVVTVLAVAFPLGALLPLRGTFAVDWANHCWISAYTGEYVREHAALPVVLSTNDRIGMPFPVFYGALFYPLIGLLTTWLNPGLAVRVVVVLVTWVQYRAISHTFAGLGAAPWFARGVACLTIWAIYPLTNLYNRSAITEYVATSLLASAVAVWFQLLHARLPSERQHLAHIFGLLFALTAGVHPITALYSLPFLVLLLVAAYEQHGRYPAFWQSLLKSLTLPAMLTLVVLAPWVAALEQFQTQLHINSKGGLPSFYPAIDNWATRFYPVPFDRRVLDVPVATVSTAYLDAQLNLPLLILLLGLLLLFLIRSRGARLAGLRSVAFAFVAFAVFLWLSLSPSIYEHLPASARLIQIAYRLITYQNLSILLGILVLASCARRRGAGLLFRGRVAAGVLLACLALSAAGVVIKWQRAKAIRHLDGSARLTRRRSERRGGVDMPGTFYGYTDYGTPSLYAPLTEPFKGASVSVATGRDFGEPEPLQLDEPAEAWIALNVQAFSWNHLALDGVPVPDYQLRLDADRLAVHVPAGAHTLTVEIVPDATWLLLRTLSLAVLAVWFAGVAYLAVPVVRRRPHWQP